MGRLRLNRRRRALAGYVLGCLLIAAGAFVAGGLAAALITAGALTAVSFLLLADVEEEATSEPPAVAAQTRIFDPTL